MLLLLQFLPSISLFSLLPLLPDIGDESAHLDRNLIIALSSVGSFFLLCVAGLIALIVTCCCYCNSQQKNRDFNRGNSNESTATQNTAEQGQGGPLFLVERGNSTGSGTLSGEDETDGGLGVEAGKKGANEDWGEDPWQMVYCLTQTDRPWQALCAEKMESKIAERKCTAKNDNDARGGTDMNRSEPRYVEINKLLPGMSQRQPANGEVTDSQAQPSHTAIQVDNDPLNVTYRHSYYMASPDVPMMSLDSHESI